MGDVTYRPQGLKALASVPGAPIVVFGLSLSLYAFEASRMSSFQSVGFVSSGTFGISFCGVVLALCLAVLYQRRPMFRAHRYPVVGFAVAFLYAAASVALLNGGLRFQVAEFTVVAKIVQAVAPIVLLACWVECLAPYRARQAAVIYAMAVIALGLLNVVTSFFRDAAAHAVVSLLPVISAACLYWFKDHSNSFDSARGDRLANALAMQSFDRSLSKGGGSSRTLLSFLLSFVLPMALFTFAFGNVHYSWVPAQDGSLVSFSIQLAAGLGTMLGGAILLVLVGFFWGRRKMELYPLMALPILLCALYLTAVLEAELSFVYVVPLNIAQKIVLFLVLMAPFLAPSPLSPLSGLCLAFAFYYLGKTSTSFAHSISSSFANSILVIIAISGVLVSLIAAMLINKGTPADQADALKASFEDELGPDSSTRLSSASSGEEVSRGLPLCVEGEGFAGQDGSFVRLADEHAAADAEAEGERRYEADSGKSESMRRLKACEMVATEFRLTRREEEVLQLLSEGMNAQSVAETLVVSVSTAKSHMRNIYSKMGIHTQNELIIMVHRAMESDGDRG